MNTDLASKIKSLRKEKNVSQEQLANYLNVSFQAVSKWETGVSCPDISLLPLIARYFGITVDELLQSEVIDEQEKYAEYENRCYELFRNGKNAKEVELWQQAYREMPNNIKVKEMLMSAYFDTDQTAYRDNILELATEIYNSDAPTYYKGQAITQAAITYAKSGSPDLAEKWALKSMQINHCQEVIMSQIYDGEDLLSTVSFFTYWAFHELFYMVCRIDANETVPLDQKEKQAMFQSLAKLYETLYNMDNGNHDDGERDGGERDDGNHSDGNHDGGDYDGSDYEDGKYNDGNHDGRDYEVLTKLYVLHKKIAEQEIHLQNDENTVRQHLEKALECVKKSMTAEAHTLSLPLLYGWKTTGAPSDNGALARQMEQDLVDSAFDTYRKEEWFQAILTALHELVSC